MKKILLVDDDRDFVELMKTRLESNNYSVVGSSDANEIFELVEKEAPDLIILDIIMPNLSGYEVCERLKEGKKTAKIPIILLTSKDLVPKGIAERCLKLGVEAYFLKPVDSKILLHKMGELTGNK